MYIYVCMYICISLFNIIHENNLNKEADIGTQEYRHTSYTSVHPYGRFP